MPLKMTFNVYKNEKHILGTLSIFMLTIIYFFTTLLNIKNMKSKHYFF